MRPSIARREHSALPGFSTPVTASFSVKLLVEKRSVLRILFYRGILLFIEPTWLGTRSRMVMLSLRKPSAESIHRFLAGQAKLPFTYSAVGATAGTPPAGFVVDHTRIKLGEGEPVFQ